MKFKKNIFLLTLMIFALPVFADISETNSEPTLLDWSVQNLVLILGLVAIVGALFGLFNSTKTVWRSQTINQFVQGGMPYEKAVQQAGQASFLRYIYRELAGGVPLEKEEDVLLNHDYDGIQELDNNLPPWWVGMFYISILIAGIYMVVYHVSDIGISSEEQYVQEVRDAEIAMAAYRTKQAEIDKAKKTETISSENVTALIDEESIAYGKELFMDNCSQCHGKSGEGGIGPNLTDEYWIHGGGVKNIFNTITYGKHEKGMIKWKDKINPSDIQKVASFIITLGGTNPENPKDPEGEIWKEEGEVKSGEQPIGMN